MEWIPTFDFNFPTALWQSSLVVCKVKLNWAERREAGD